MKHTPSEVLEGWKAYWKHEPFGDDWWQTAVIACAAANPHIKKSLAPYDFIPGQQHTNMITDLEEMERALTAFCGVA
jgi:hypothetical protein